LHTRYFIWNYSELGGMIDPVFYALTTRMERNNQEVDLREIREEEIHNFIPLVSKHRCISSGEGRSGRQSCSCCKEPDKNMSTDHM